MILKNIGIARAIDVLNDEKPFILARSITHRPDFSNIVLVSFTDLLSFYVTFNYISYKPATVTPYTYIFFIPHSFIFEIVFDFFHYCFHRLCHTNKLLYKHVHSHHHADSRITVYTTFCQHPIDLLLTNIIPVICTSYIVPINHYYLFIFFWCKSFLEISGHLGKDINGLSFPQFIWLPKFFNICLKAKHHNFHHIMPLKNFAKRFTLWDKVFGTFQDC